jgi:hypothetical protein
MCEGKEIVERLVREERERSVEGWRQMQRGKCRPKDKQRSVCGIDDRCASIKGVTA